MGLVVLCEQERALVAAQRGPKLEGGMELLLDPQGASLEERLEPARGDAEVGLENALEFEQRLVVEPHGCEVGGGDAAGAKAVVDRAGGKGRVTLLAGESLLLRGSHDLPVAQQARGTVVVERGDSQNPCSRHDRHLTRRPGEELQLNPQLSN